MVIWLCVCDGMDQIKMPALLATLSPICIRQHAALVLYVSFVGKYFNSYWNSYCEITFGAAEKLILMQRLMHLP